MFRPRAPSPSPGPEAPGPRPWAYSNFASTCFAGPRFLHMSDMSWIPRGGAPRTQCKGTIRQGILSPMCSVVRVRARGPGPGPGARGPGPGAQARDREPLLSRATLSDGPDKFETHTNCLGIFFEDLRLKVQIMMKAILK